MKKDTALSVAMPTIKIITLGMLMWGANVLSTEATAGSACYTCSTVGGAYNCVEPNPGGSGYSACAEWHESGSCILSGTSCTAS